MSWVIKMVENGIKINALTPCRFPNFDISGSPLPYSACVLSRSSQSLLGEPLVTDPLPSHSRHLSRTCKLLIRITQVCQEIRDIKRIHSTKTNHSPLGTGRTNKEPPQDKCEKGGKGCTRSTGNKKHARCEDLHSNRDT